MPISAGRPTNPNLSEILEGLLKEGIDFILVGGFAAVIQGAPLTTMDVDIVHKKSPENVAKLLSFLKSIDAFYRRLDDKMTEPKESDLLGDGHCLFTSRLGPLDVLAAIEEGNAMRIFLSIPWKLSSGATSSEYWILRC